MNDSDKDNRCEAEVAIVPSIGTTGVLPTPTSAAIAVCSTTIDTTSNCPSHCQTTSSRTVGNNDSDNENSNSNYNNLIEKTFNFPIDEDVRWHKNPKYETTNFDNSDLGTQENSFIFTDSNNIQEIVNPFKNSNFLSEVTIMIDVENNDNDSNDMTSTTTHTQLQTHDDISQVLENFNSILDSIDLNYNSSIDHESCTSDNDLGPEFSGGDVNNDEEEFLIIVDEYNKSNSGTMEEDKATTPSPLPPCTSTLNPTTLDSDNASGTGDEEPDPEEGYESDRPMVRASMRKLKPVQMLPMPNLPQTINESPSHQTMAGFVTTLNSPVTNQILVTSLINTILSPGYSDGVCSNNSNSADHHSPTLTTTATGSQSQCHSRSHSHNNNNSFNLNGNASDLTMNAVTDLVNGEDSNIQTNTAIPVQKENRLNNNSVQGSSSSSRSSDSSGNSGMSTNLISEPNSNLYNNSGSETVGVNLVSTLEEPLSELDAAFEEAMRNGISIRGDLIVESVGIGGPMMIVQSAPSNSENARTTNASHSSTPETTSTGTRGNGAGRHVLSSGGSPGRWPHRLSSVLALIGCTLGLNNICRFGLLSVEYGANFTIQFIFLSLVFGIPLLTFHMSSGQYLASGIIDMWKISPIFQGIGIGLVISQAMVGVYTAVGVSWMFIYFRDSFITRYDLYRWAKCFRDYRECDQYLYNATQLAETVPDYFNGVVLQRGSPDYPSSNFPTSSLKFTVAFNLAVVWMLVFVSLSKGLKSYGKAIHGFVLVPIAAILVLASKMVGLVPSDDTSSLFGQTAWSNFFFNSQTWVIAAREAFFTWGLLGACIMQVTSHNRPSHSLKSDASIVILITIFVLLLSAFLGNACYSVLVSHGYAYVSSSFESDQTYKFLIKTPTDNLLPSSMNYHTSFLMGVRIVTPSDMPNGNTVSGYQVLRLATELFPATMAVLGTQGLSPFWTVLFYFTFILFGIAQQLAIWYCVIKGVIAIKAKTLKSWETTITFFVCAFGFLLGLPLCTEYGIFVEYFLDYAIGSGWWIMVLYLLELVAVFVVRGAPYCGENIVTVLMTGSGKLTTFMAPLISFLWNVILPVAMLVLSITSFKSGNIRELYDWNPLHGYAFWPSWTRELGTLIQLLPILTVPFVAIVQSCRYLTNGPPDLFDRMQQLYRPHSRGLLGRTLSAQLRRDGSGTNSSSRNSSINQTSEDPPPKYTPPPSYSTATSARIAKFLRASLRRSLRRLPGSSHSTENLPPPPNYASVILEINSQNQQAAGSSANSDSVSSSPTPSNCPVIPILISSPTTESLENAHHILTSEEMNRPILKINVAQSHTLGRHLETSSSDKARGSLRRIASDITPREVARILRASFRQDSKSNVIPNENTNNIDRSLQRNELGLDYSDHLRLFSSGFLKNYNFDFSRKRPSNESQLALISCQSRNNSLGSNDLPYYSDLMNLGIINPSSFQSNPLLHTSGDRSNRNGSNGETLHGPGHLRSSSLTVPGPYHSMA